MVAVDPSPIAGKSADPRSATGFGDLRRRASGVAAAAFLGAAAVVALLGSLDVLGQGHAEFVSSPHLAPSVDHWLGTDALGRDLRSRTLRAAEPSLWTGTLSATLSLLFGGTLGIAAGLRRGTIDRAGVGLAQVIGAVPPLMLIVGLAALLWPGIVVASLSIAAIQWVGAFRTMRAETQRMASETYVLASRAMGASNRWIARHHVLPAQASVLATTWALHFAYAIKAEAVLGYLGVLDPARPSWGRMLAESVGGMSHGIWWPLVAAAVPLTLVILSAQTLADRLDPRDDD